MGQRESLPEYSQATPDATAPVTVPAECHRITIPHGPFEVVIWLTPDGRFVGLDEVRVRKNFLSLAQRLATSKSHDVDEFYRD